MLLLKDYFITIYRCPQTHQGQTCQYSCNVCAYDMIPGDCEGLSGEPEERWYFNKRTQTCEQFQYSGKI